LNSPAVDLHCHLDLYSSPVAAAEHANQAGAYVLSVTTTPKAWHGTALLAKGCTRVKTALGLHPQIAHERIDELALFDELLPRTRYVGEIGLDAGPESKEHIGRQVVALDHILRSTTKAGGRILTIHSRRAVGAVLDALVRHPDAGIPVLHWFTGTKSELRRAIEMGCWFSVGPAMAATKKGSEIIAALPKSKVLTETDGPFGTVNKRQLLPGDVGGALNALARCWHVDRQEAAATVLSTFRQVLSGGTGGQS
jgi:TatD DNase family protein